MKSISILRTLIVALFIGCLQPILFAAPDEHLAALPQPTAQEKEIISLLQINQISIDQLGQITIILYNPTKYILKGCAVRVSFPTDNIQRVYFSEAAQIRPFTDGRFEVSTQLFNKVNQKMECEMLTLSYTSNKKS